MAGDGILSFEPSVGRLVVAAADGEFADGGFSQIDDQLRKDRLSSDGHLLLPLLEPAIRRHVPDWDFLPIATGLRRRARLETAMVGQLARAVNEHLLSRGVDALLVGDLAAASLLHGQTPGLRDTDSHVGIRRAPFARLLVPHTTSWSAVREAVRSTAIETGATVLDRPRTGLRLHCSEVRVGRYAGPAFAFPSAQESVWHRAQGSQPDCPETSTTPSGPALRTPSVEYLIFDSIARSSTAAPRIRWLVDAVSARQRGIAVDWSAVVAVAHKNRWAAPVHHAMAYLIDVGFDIPPSVLDECPSHDTPVDRALQRALERPSGATGRRRWTTLAPLVACRSIRHWRGA